MSDLPSENEWGEGAVGDNRDAPPQPASGVDAAGAAAQVAAQVASANAAQGAETDSASAEELFTDASQVLSADDVLATVTRERDEYLEALQRLKAEFDNHRRRTTEQAAAQRDQAAASLVEKLLPVLDSCDAALAHDAEAVRPIVDSLTGTLAGAGLERLEPNGEPFDPELHEAVMHEAGEGQAVPTVSQVLRAGYAWNGRVVRPAMVQVSG